MGKHSRPAATPERPVCTVCNGSGSILTKGRVKTDDGWVDTMQNKQCPHCGGKGKV